MSFESTQIPKLKSSAQVEYSDDFQEEEEEEKNNYS
jgi:hypothetical protein